MTGTRLAFMASNKRQLDVPMPLVLSTNNTTNQGQFSGLSGWAFGAHFGRVRHRTAGRARASGRSRTTIETPIAVAARKFCSDACGPRSAAKLLTKDEARPWHSRRSPNQSEDGAFQLILLALTSERGNRIAALIGFPARDRHQKEPVPRQVTRFIPGDEGAARRSGKKFIPHGKQTEYLLHRSAELLQPGIDMTLDEAVRLGG